jgi:hypothetical protein
VQPVVGPAPGLGAVAADELRDVVKCECRLMPPSSSPLQRVLRALALGEASDRFALAKLRLDHATATEEELRLRLALRTLPPHLGRVLAIRKGYPELAR